jgi:hypothetical protein
MRLIQFLTVEGGRKVGAILANGDEPKTVEGAASVRELAMAADRGGQSLEQTVRARGFGETIEYDQLIEEKRLLLPLDHPDPAHCIVALTGLSHLGSAASRDAMHSKLERDELTDSMKMFKLGLEGGKPARGEIGVQPEWAYKGDGTWLVAPEQPLDLPGYAEDGGEEGEIAALYVIGDDGTPLRLGFALANEYSDHAMEQQNYLYLAHSKLRQSSFGPELLVGDIPDDVRGSIRIERNGSIAWSGELLSGEANMCHSLANLEYHHFKYSGFRRPGDVHVYYIGASGLSCSDGFVARSGDRFVVDVPLFGRPLRNTLAALASETVVNIRTL